jgi:starch-binding outer membrane protein SusE/F
MKKLNILFLLILSLGSNAKNLNSQNLTGTDYSLVNQSGSISVSLGVNLSLQPFHALNVTLPSGLYRFKASNTSGSTYFGGVGFPVGTTSSATDFINVPAGEYNVYLTGGTYSFVAVTTRMIVGERFSYNLNYMGNNNYCASNLVFDNNYIRFYLTGVAGGPYFGSSTFPSGQLVSIGALLVPNGTYTVCVDSNNMSSSFTNTLSVEEVNLEKASVYPNPSENEWNFKLKNNSKNAIEIYNCLGKKVNEYTFKGDTFSINSTTLSSGIYFAHILSDNDLTILKLIKK